MFSDWFQAVFLNALTFRPAQMRCEDDAGAVFGRVFDRRDSRTNARVVVNLAVFDWHVEIDANEDSLAFKLKVFYGELRHCRFPIANCRMSIVANGLWS
jgi:hypothetical protein